MRMPSVDGATTDTDNGAPLLPRAPWPAMRLLLIGVGVVVAPTMAAHWGASALLPADSAANVPILALLRIAVAIAAYAWFVRRFEHRPVREFSAPRAGRESVAGVALGAGLFGATVLVLFAAGVFRLGGLGHASSLAGALALAASAAFVEEVVFRGLLFRLLESAFGSVAALAGSSAVFGVLHLMSPGATWFGAVAIVLEAGLLLGAAFMLTRRLWLPVGLHLGWNFVQGGVFGIPVSGQPSTGLLQGRLDGPGWLSGGTFGAEGSVVAIVLCLLAFVVLLRKARAAGHVMPYRAGARQGATDG